MYKYYKEILTFQDIMAISNCLNQIVKNNGTISDELILKNIEDKKVDMLFIKEFINNKKFTIIKKKYSEMQNLISYYNKCSIEKLTAIFLKYTENNVLSYVDIALVLNELNKKIRMIDNDAFLIKYIFFHDNDLSYKIEKLLIDMPSELSNLDIKKIINSKFTAKILDVKKIETFSDIKNFDIELLYLIFLEDIEKISCIAETYLYILNDIEQYHSKIKELIWKQNEIFVIDKRYSINGIDQTLEEIGNQLGFTRERARQIINRAVEKLKKYKDEFLKIVGTLFDIYKTDDDLLEMEVLEKYLGEDNIKYYLAVLLDKDVNLETSINYDENYKVIYYHDKLTEAINKKLLLLDNVIFFKNFQNYTIFEQRIIDNKYRKRNSYYIKTNVNKSLIYCGIIDELFPNGCKIHDKENIALINRRYYDIYEVDEKVDGRILGTYVDRENYCMIDSGTFINRNMVPIIDDEFKAIITNYIYTYKSVYYSQIFEKFKEKFNEYNITNWYYAKGIIDNFSIKDLESKKAYIQIKDSDSTPLEEIRQFAKEQNYIFSMEQIKKKFPGVKSYIIYNLLYSMEDLVFLSKEKYVLVDKIKLKLEDVNFIFENIEFLFNSLKTKIISIKKLYSRMKILYSDFFEKNDFILDDYSLFSILKILFKDKYYFYRPLIGKEKINSNSSRGVIMNYLEDYDVIKIDSIVKYIQKMNIRCLTIEEIFETTSEQFLQIDKETIVKKEIASINKFELEAISKSIRLHINNYGLCYISKVSSYVNFPNLKYKWNKYLLLGIVRTYLRDEYRIIQTNRSNNYLNLEFEVRRN